MKTAPSLLHEGPDGWWLDPAGAAVHAATRTAVVADVHLGYEWARGGDGDCVPGHTLGETLAKLGGVLARSPGLTRLVVAGDFVESRRPCFRTARDVAALGRWLSERGVDLVCVRGNHDPPYLAAAGTLDVGGWTVAHGDRKVNAPRTVTGHHHPVLRADGVNAPCFLVGPSAIVLPAFSENAAGVSIGTVGLTEGPDGAPLRCVASAGGELLDFGPIAELIKALR